MELATKHVPPRSAVRLREISLALQHAQIVGAVASSSGVWDYVVYVMALGVVALARSLKAGYHLTAFYARNIARATWAVPIANHQFNQDHDQSGAHIVISELLADPEGKNRARHHEKSLAQLLSDKFTTAIKGHHNKSDKQRHHRVCDVFGGSDKSHGAHLRGEILRLARAFGNSTSVPRRVGEA